MAPLTRNHADDEHSTAVCDLGFKYYEQRASVLLTFLVRKGTFIAGSVGGDDNAVGISSDEQSRVGRRCVSSS